MSVAKHREYDLVRGSFYGIFRMHAMRLRGLSIEATAIEYAMLEQTLEWENRRYQWNWFDFKRKFRGVPSRFELMISVDRELCGIAIGKPSRGRRHLSVYFIEGNPDGTHPLKGSVLPLILEGATLYAEMLGCSYVRIIEPDKHLINKYEDNGYLVAKGKRGRVYCEKGMKE